MKYQIIIIVILSFIGGFIGAFYNTRMNLLEEELKSTKEELRNTYHIDCEWSCDDK